MKHHSCRPLLWVCTSFIFGIVINKYFNISFLIFAFWAAACLLLSFLIRRSKLAAVFLLIALLCAGAMYSKNYETVSLNHISKLSYGYYSDLIQVEGMVVSDVEQRPFFKGKKTVFSLDVKRVKSKWGWKDRQGVILVNLFREEDLRYGDYIKVEGKMHRPFNFAHDSNFSYRDYLYRHGITFIISVKKTGCVQILKRDQGHFIKMASLRLKHRLSEVLHTNLPYEAAGLMQAFLLGDRYNIPKSVNDLFKLSGVAHIIAISGFNIGIVTYIIVTILKMFPMPRAAQYILTMVLLILYAVMTGGQAPVVRATIMSIVFLVSFLVERKPDPVNTLAAAALILLLMNPLNLFDAGFQLSFISVLSIVLLSPSMMAIFDQRLLGLGKKDEGCLGRGKKYRARLIQVNVMKYLLQSAVISVAAYLGVAVMVAYYFKLITPVVIIANLVVVPLASLLIFLGMGLLVVGVIFPFAAFAFANCITAVLNLMIASVFLFAQIPGAYFKIKNFSLWGVFLYYGLLIMIISLYCSMMKGFFDRPKEFL